MSVFLLSLAGLAAVPLSWVLADIGIALTKKPLPDLPKDTNRHTHGLTLLYDALSDPEHLTEGVRLDEDFVDECLRPTLTYIHSRYDCADFGLLFLIRLYKDYKDYLPKKSRQAIQDTFLGFKYWMDEPGRDSMCYWSENHQMMFAVCEYLAGREWPDEIFTNNGMTGKDHAEKALERINIWLEQRFAYGFSEWYSNNYYPEDIAPMANFIEYADDKDTVERMKIVFDLLWFDVATHSVNNTFVASSSRMYTNNKASDVGGNSVKDEMRVIWQGAGIRELNECAGESQFNINGVEFKLRLCGRMSRNFAMMYERGHYTVPDVIRRIGEDKEPVVILSSSGLSPEDMEAEGLIGPQVHQIMAQFGAETFTNPQVVDNTLRYLSKTKMYYNKFLNPFRYMDIKLLRLLKVPEIISRKVTLMTHGVALNRGNVYYYRTPYYSLSTAVAQGVDSCGAQGHIWTANLAPDLTLFTTQPARDDENEKKHKESPGYWVGNGRQPMSVQDKNINITIYRIPKKKRLLEFHIADMSHAFVPRDRYDEIEVENNRMFGRKGKVLVSLCASGELAYRPYDPAGARALMNFADPPADAAAGAGREFDLVLCGGEYHAYVTELSDTDTESFEQFKSRILSNPVDFRGSSVAYTSRGKHYEVGYDRRYLMDGAPQPLEYERFDSIYAKAARKDDTLVIRHGGKELLLNLKTMRREERDLAKNQHNE